MNHEEYDNLTPLHALGALDGDDLARLADHLGDCADCRRAVREYERVATELALSLPPVRPGPDVRERLLAQVRGHASQPGRVVAAPFAGWRVAAAAMLLAAVALGLLYHRTREDAAAVAAENLRLVRELETRDREARQVRQELAAAKQQVEGLQQSVREISGRLDETAQARAALEKRLAEKKTELDRLARMDALIRDIKSQVLALQGTDEAKGATGRIVWKGREVAFATTLPPPVEGKVYELWALVDGKPVPAGTYDARGNLVQDYWKVPEGAAIAGFAISLEARAVDTPTAVVMVPVP